MVYELGATTVLGLINSTDIAFHLFAPWFTDIRLLRDRDQKCSFHHTLHEDNFCADILGKMGCKLDIEYEFLQGPPLATHLTLHTDTYSTKLPMDLN